jgi:hypothetical protein
MPIFGSKSNPANAAQPYLNQIPGTITPYYQPYIDQGQKSLKMLGQQYGQQVYNPDQIINTLGSGYETSPGYEWDVQQGTEAVNNAAAAGGYAGTPQHQQQAAEMTEGIADKDYNTYMDEALGLRSQGLRGEEGLNSMGYSASNTLAENLAQVLMSQANLAYAGAANKNQMQRGLLGGAIGAGLDAYGLSKGIPMRRI